MGLLFFLQSNHITNEQKCQRLYTALFSGIGLLFLIGGVNMKKVDEKFEYVLFNFWVAGWSARMLSKELKKTGVNVSHTTIAKYFKQFKKQFGVAKDVAMMYAMRLFEIFKSYKQNNTDDAVVIRELIDLIMDVVLRAEVIKKSNQAIVITNDFEGIKKELYDAFNNQIQDIKEIIIDEEQKQFLVLTKRGD